MINISLNVLNSWSYRFTPITEILSPLSNTNLSNSNNYFNWSFCQWTERDTKSIDIVFVVGLEYNTTDETNFTAVKNIELNVFANIR
ncbi:hypothetical protein I4U23_022825 [Adineta vaga]|nr:hypothetical protein I4U23_022825 [Adineta vaga]